MPGIPAEPNGNASELVSHERLGHEEDERPVVLKVRLRLTASRDLVGSADVDRDPIHGDVVPRIGSDDVVPDGASVVDG